MMLTLKKNNKDYSRRRYRLYFDEDLGFTEQETLFEVTEEMTVEENNGFSTIEVYENSSPVNGYGLIWSNGKD